MTKSFIVRHVFFLALLFCFSVCTVTAGSSQSQSAPPPNLQAKQPPVRIKVTPSSNKHTFPPIVQIPPEHAEKLKTLLEQVYPGQKNPAR